MATLHRAFNLDARFRFLMSYNYCINSEKRPSHYANFISASTSTIKLLISSLAVHSLILHPCTPSFLFRLSLRPSVFHSLSLRLRYTVSISFFCQTFWTHELELSSFVLDVHSHVHVSRNARTTNVFFRIRRWRRNPSATIVYVCWFIDDYHLSITQNWRDDERRRAPRLMKPTQSQIIIYIQIGTAIEWNDSVDDLYLLARKTRRANRRSRTFDCP